jgi:septal ring factor EnvC (AmiA/AmiB activator)
MSDTKPIPSTPTTPAVRIFLLVLLIALAAITGFAFHERNSARQLSAQNEQVTAALSQTHTQIDALNAKLNTIATTLAEIPPAAASPARPVPGPHPAAARVKRDDPRWKKLQTQLDAQGQQIDATRQQIDATQQDLAGTRTELQGSIARTHDELVVLQKKGERNYYEFDLGKAKQFQHEGTLGVRLRKANTKHQYADLELLVDDVDVSQKHVNLYQPVMFYAGDNGRPVELVVNKITKDHVHGYVSEPKYRQAELASMATAGANRDTSPDSATNPPPATSTRKKLDLPK